MNSPSTTNILTPNARTVDQNDEHLTKPEIAVLQKWNQQENRLLMAEQVVNLLHAPPFLMLVPIPHNYDEGVRFDINWKKKKFGRKSIYAKRSSAEFYKRYFFPSPTG
ncbi:hypothetical protein ACX0G9_04475 [Flavitalea flava]